MKVMIFARRAALLLVTAVLLLAFTAVAQANVMQEDWYEGVRVRVATEQETLDFTAENRMDSGVPSQNIHVVAANEQGLFLNTSVALTGSHNDEVRLNRSLVRGRIDATVPVYNMQTGRVHEVDIHVKTLATPSTHPYVLAGPAWTGIEGHRTAEILSGQVLLDGQLWFDLAAEGDVMVWHFSSVTPPSER